MMRNRLAQNHLMRQLCSGLAIPLLDTTSLLQLHIEGGQNVFFPDESHLNEAGQALVADALATFLRQMGLPSPRTH